MPLMTQGQPLPDDADGIDVGRDGLGQLATVAPGAARAPEGEGNVDDDERSGLVPIGAPDDHDREQQSSLSIPVAYDLLGRNPKDGEALNAIRLCVIQWARRDGLAGDAEDIAQDVIQKLISPVVPPDGSVLILHTARRRETFRGFLHGLYLNARRPAVRDLVRRRVQRDIDDIDRAHREDATTDGQGGTNSFIVETPVEISDTLADALDALRAANPRGYRAVLARCYRNMESAEVARYLGVSAANERQIHARAIRFLREYLGGTAR
ncbi:MAG: hypothetical protein KGS10_16750 [Chloroflexi bacterium]|jgi:DNA-directed RNA polymerase specialized sigma24 family protein|nr:hypothetical protein [Chloroflexota bacterium]